MYKFIEWSKLDFKKQGGKEKMRCVECDEQRTDKKDKSLVIDHDKGYGRCFYCEALTFKESNKQVNNKVYVLPEQDKWKNYTELSDNWVKLLEARKIPQFVAMGLGWTCEEYYQPKRQKNVSNLVFNTFIGETLVNKKYRDSGKAFTQSKGTKSVFYNLNSIIGQKEAYIVEGELDVAALYVVGIKNVISVPNGANDNDDYWINSEPYLKGIEKFIIAVDNDEKGNTLKEAIAQRLGRYRCECIEFKFKDANGDLIEGILEDSIKQRKRFPVSGTFTVSDMKQEMLSFYHNGMSDTIYPKHACFGEFKEMFSVMLGHLATGTGIPSHGKSAFTEWLVLNIVNDYGYKASFFSPEHQPLAIHQITLLEKAVGKNFYNEVDGVPRITLEDIDRYEEWANEKIYLTSPESGEIATTDWLFDKFKEHIYMYGTKVFVIDAFNKVQLDRGDKLDEINRFLTRATSFCQTYNCVIFLIVHPVKMKKNLDTGMYDEPDLYSCSGSADFRNQTHDGYCIYRHWPDKETGEEGKTEFINLKTKMSFQGEIGARVSFNYDRVNGRFYAQGMPKSTFDMTKPEAEENDTISDVTNVITPSDSAFEDEFKEIFEQE